MIEYDVRVFAGEGREEGLAFLRAAAAEGWEYVEGLFDGQVPEREILFKRTMPDPNCHPPDGVYVAVDGRIVGFVATAAPSDGYEPMVTAYRFRAGQPLEAFALKYQDPT